MAGYSLNPTMSALPLLFAKSSICWNPIIYVILNDQVNLQVIVKRFIQISDWIAQMVDRQTMNLAVPSSNLAVSFQVKLLSWTNTLLLVYVHGSRPWHLIWSYACPLMVEVYYLCNILRYTTAPHPFNISASPFCPKLTFSDNIPAHSL